jgi:hypothetical protein
MSKDSKYTLNTALGPLSKNRRGIKLMHCIACIKRLPYIKFQQSVAKEFKAHIYKVQLTSQYELK